MAILSVRTQAHQISRLLSSWRVNYADMIARLPLAGISSPDQVRKIMVKKWYETYHAHCPHSAEVHEVATGGGKYIYDFTAELLASGEMPIEVGPDDRVVAAFGFSKAATSKRNRGRMQGFPRGGMSIILPELKSYFDRGHYLGRSMGGSEDINLFPQLISINRGTCDMGKTYRKMERYCLAHEGVFFFSRPFYYGISDHPAAIEYGVFMDDETLWYNVFPNVRTLRDIRRLGAALVALRHAQMDGTSRRIKTPTA
jgi:hypothetical protein